MPNFLSQEAFERLLTDLVALPTETEWVEFKENNEDPHAIGEYISALSNSAALVERPYGYLVWGVRDHGHELVGTTFDPARSKVGNEDLENWLTRSTSPPTSFWFHCGSIGGSALVVLEIARAAHAPVAFRGQKFVRVGSYKKKLVDHPDREHSLWRVLDRTPIELAAAAAHLSDDATLERIDFRAYFDMQGRPIPEDRAVILSALSAERYIEREPSGQWTITNLGALLYAREMSSFPLLARKAPRIIRYRGSSRAEAFSETEAAEGYAAGFEQLMGILINLLPRNEVIEKALRHETPMYPALAVREIVANALVHQDLTLTGTGPMIELFEDRLEISNPGTPLVDPDRFVDAPPRSRNEALASHLRRVGVCEERGSGWDKVGFQVEYHQLPAPLVETYESHTRVTLFSPRPLTMMDKADRIRAVYLHACLRYVSAAHMTNTSVRERFGIAPRNSATASRLIGEAVMAGVVVAYDAAASKRLMRYVPAWAAGGRSAS